MGMSIKSLTKWQTGFKTIPAKCLVGNIFV